MLLFWLSACESLSTDQPWSATTIVARPSWVRLPPERLAQNPPLEEEVITRCLKPSTALDVRSGAVLVVHPGKYSLDVTCGELGTGTWVIEASFLDSVTIRSMSARALAEAESMFLRRDDRVILEVLPEKLDSEWPVPCDWFSTDPSVATVIPDGRAALLVAGRDGRAMVGSACLGVGAFLDVTVRTE